MEIKDQIRRMREAKGYSQECMAFQLGMSQNGYGKIENGKVDIKLKTLHKIAQVLEVELHQLLCTHPGKRKAAQDATPASEHGAQPGFSQREQKLYEELLASKEVHLAL